MANHIRNRTTENQNQERNMQPQKSLTFQGSLGTCPKNHIMK